jgi:hypothetical protein
MVLPSQEYVQEQQPLMEAPAEAQQPQTPEHEFFEELCMAITVATHHSSIAQAMRYTFIRAIFQLMERKYELWSVHPELSQMLTELYGMRQPYMDEENRPEDHTEMLEYLNELRERE